MPRKFWFQHDFNARKKEQLSLLRKAGGNEAYGMFWVLQELHGEMQTHKYEATNSFIINEASLVRELNINSRRLPAVQRLMYESCGIVFENIPKTIGNVSYINWKVTLPKALIFMGNRFPKNGDPSRDRGIRKWDGARQAPPRTPEPPRKPLPKPRAPDCPCGAKEIRPDGSRWGCSLNMGHDGPHKWEELA